MARGLLVACLSAGLADAVQIPPIPPPAEPPVIQLVLPSGVDAEDCEVHYDLRGPSGGRGGFGRGDEALALPIFHGGLPAESLKAYVYCAGFQVWTLALDGLTIRLGRPQAVDLISLGTVPLLGRVRSFSRTLARDGWLVHVRFFPSWSCRFFGRPDCALGGWPVGSASLDADGRFLAWLPDLARDAMVSSFDHPGSFSFELRDWNESRRLPLAAVGPSQASGDVPVAADYPAEVVFEMRRRR